MKAIFSANCFSFLYFYPVSGASDFLERLLIGFKFVLDVGGYIRLSKKNGSRALFFVGFQAFLACKIDSCIGVKF